MAKHSFKVLSPLVHLLLRCPEQHTCLIFHRLTRTLESPAQLPDDLVQSPHLAPLPSLLSPLGRWLHIHSLFSPTASLHLQLQLDKFLEQCNQLIQRGNEGNLDTTQLPRHLSYWETQWKVTHFPSNFISREMFFICFRMAFFLPFLSYCVTYLVSAVALWQTGYVTIGYYLLEKSEKFLAQQVS